VKFGRFLLIVRGLGLGVLYALIHRVELPCFFMDTDVSSIMISNKSLSFFTASEDVRPDGNYCSKSLSFVLYSVTHTLSVLVDHISDRTSVLKV
jgi:hypothetical protein